MDGVFETQPDRTDLPLVVMPVVIESMIGPFKQNFTMLENVARVRMYEDFTLDEDTIVERCKDADAVMALLMELTRHAGALDMQVKQGDWDGADGFELFGKKLGIIGLGGIGQTVAGIANAFGMKVSAWNSHVPAQVFENLNVTPVEDMNELISNSDVVSVHMPLLDSTRGIITAKNLDALRPGTLFVNTARAEVIEPGALLARLQRGDIPAALDVFDHEPLAADDPLCKIPGIVLTPHIAWRTDGAYIGMTKQVVQSIAAFFKGEEFNVVV